MRVITLLTDFGMQSPYPAAMKGVILGIAPDARVVDLTHEIAPQGVQEGAFVLWSLVREFPQGTVHCAVVDPGVGTGRRGLILEAGGCLLVGPDNGLLDPAARVLGEPRAYEIANPRYLRGEISHTFHGRDVFAPVAAHLARGVPPEEIGAPLGDRGWVALGVDFQGGRWDPETGAFLGQIVYIDRFGNAITNVPTERFRERVGFDARVELSLRGAAATRTVRLRRSYGFAERGELLLVPGSHGLIEVSVREGSARELLGLRVNDPLALRPLPR